MQAENDEIAHNDGHYKKGKMSIYNYVNTKNRDANKITHHTLDKTDKSAASKTYKDFKQELQSTQPT